jgi:hypothetical protein
LSVRFDAPRHSLRVFEALREHAAAALAADRAKHGAMVERHA